MPAEQLLSLESHAGSGQLLVDRLAVWVGFSSDQQQQQQQHGLDKEGEAPKAGTGINGGGRASPLLAEAVVAAPKLFEASEDSSESSADLAAGTSGRSRPRPAPTPTSPPQVVDNAPAAEDGLRFGGAYLESGLSAESSADSFESADGLLFSETEAFAAAEKAAAAEAAEAEEFMLIRLEEGSAEGEAVVCLSPPLC